MAPALRRLIVACIVVSSSAFPSLPSIGRINWRTAGSGWAQGPVWYIMTTTEYTAYRWLKSEGDRRDFIRRFWEKRDPLPATPENELEREFWRRVEVADGHFGQDVKPGWKTERGKVFIMLGPPDNLEQDMVLADTWGASRWIYDLGSMPFQLRLVLQDTLGIPTSRSVVKLKVRAEGEGPRSVAGAVAVRDSVLRPTDTLPLAETLVRRIPGPDGLRSLGHVMRVPEVLELDRSRVNVTSVFSLIPVQARIDFRPAETATQTGKTSVAVTIGVTRSSLLAEGVTATDPAAAILTGHLTPVEGEGSPCTLSGAFDASEDSSTPRTDPLLFQALCLVPPGRYLLDVAYQDTGNRIMGAVRDLIEVPAFASSGLGISSLVLATRLDKIEGSAPDPKAADSPFMIRNYRVIPRTTQVYAGDDDLTVFYEVHGPTTDASSRPHLEITYQFYIQDAGSWLPVGSLFTLPDEADLDQAWSVPLDGWPPGRYRLEVTVTDHVGGSTSVRGAFFEVTPGVDTPAIAASN
ncbi:MAG TPA: GWxTD domain-containing protein [Candidatus Polarisedimenticolia bacterium]|jgi:GWxTD domain-containing protein